MSSISDANPDLTALIPWLLSSSLFSQGGCRALKLQAQRQLEVRMCVSHSP